MFGTTKIAAFGATLDSVGSCASNSCRCKKLGTAISGCSPVFDVVSEDRRNPGATKDAQAANRTRTWPCCLIADPSDKLKARVVAVLAQEHSEFAAQCGSSAIKL
jgi:hypothetical protein